MEAPAAVPGEAPPELFGAVQLARFITAIDESSANELIGYTLAFEAAFDRGEKVYDVWIPTGPGWAIFYSDGGGRYMSSVPEGEPTRDPIAPVEGASVTDTFERALASIPSDLDKPFLPWLEMAQNGANASSAANEQGWLASLEADATTALENRTPVDWSALRTKTEQSFAACAIPGTFGAPITYTAAMCAAAPGAAAGAGGMLIGARTLAGDTTTLMYRLVNYIVARFGLDAAEQATDALIAEGDARREAALTSSSIEAFGTQLHLAALAYLSAALGSKFATEGAHGQPITEPMRRSATVADERNAQIGSALSVWIRDLEGDEMRRHQTIAGVVRAESGDRAAERKVDGWIEREWLFPRAVRPLLLGIDQPEVMP